MKAIFQKNELAFALLWIGIYVVLQNVAIPLSNAIGIESAAMAFFSVCMTVFLFIWVKRNHLMQYFGLCKGKATAKQMLWYLPLLLIASHGLWNGCAINFSFVGSLFYICNMLCIGFLEELLFRGFLFRALCKDNVKMAIIISSVTFGIGHLMNLINGRGAGLLSNLCQVFGAIAIGFLFVTIVYRGGSLWPCIVVHSVIDVVSAFARVEGLTPNKRILICSINFVVTVIYTLILTKTLPARSAVSESHGTS